MQIYEYRQLLDELKSKYEIIKSKQVGLDEKIEKIEKEQQNPEVWVDVSVSTLLNKKLKLLKDKKSALDGVKILIDDFLAGIELKEIDPSFSEEELASLHVALEKALNELWISTLLSGKHDSGSAVIMVHSGAGGEEAQDWAEMLSRMYSRYASSRGFSLTLVDSVPGDGAGIKSQTFIVNGEYAYGYLKAEKGVHRLVRLSPFDANNRRHTSFASLEVLPFVEGEDSEIKINPDEIVVDTYRSSGAGGQHVNKTESAIRITHLPTGIVVTCQNERSQTRNREMAMKLLISKLTEKKLAEQEKEKLEKLSLNKKIEWGSQIRSYVLHPYSLVKDHRTGIETSNVQAVLDGDLQFLINEYLRVTNNE